MSTLESTPETTEWTTQVAVRIPRDGEAGLVENARARLRRPDDVEGVEAVELRGIDPALSASVVQLDVRVTTESAISDDDLEQALADAPGTERVEGVSRIEAAR